MHVIINTPFIEGLRSGHAGSVLEVNSQKTMFSYAFLIGRSNKLIFLLICTLDWLRNIGTQSPKAAFTQVRAFGVRAFILGFYWLLERGLTFDRFFFDK